ncbi:MAG: NAD-dependent epimerase/dehydratase family protein [Methanospirillaceae archaeon]|nr:NAD-dependent epimerase/dehydratase family protein [Methanospirillaceae archaeon]
MRIFITGITGFSGQALLSHIREQGSVSHEIFGLVRKETVPDPGYHPVHGDLSDRCRMQEILSEVRPDCILHLAGSIRGTLSGLLSSNVCNTENLLYSAVESGLSPFIVAIGSAAEYGYQGTDPIPENAPVSPVSIYGITKAAQTSVSVYYCRKAGLPLCIVRTFNLIGPGQTPANVCGSIVHQMVKRKRGLTDRVCLQGSDSSRDYIDVRDAVRAYWMLAQKPREYFGQHEIFNVGSGRSYSVSEIVAIVEEIAGVPANCILAGELPDFIPDQIGDIRKITRDVGWTPAIPMQTSLADMFHHAMMQE